MLFATLFALGRVAPHVCSILIATLLLFIGVRVPYLFTAIGTEVSFQNPLAGNVLVFAFVPFALGRALYVKTQAAHTLAVAMGLVVLASGAFWVFMVDAKSADPLAALSSVVATTSWAVMMWVVLERVPTSVHRVMIGAFAFKIAGLIEGGLQYVAIEASPAEREAAIAAVLGLKTLLLGLAYGTVLAAVAVLADAMPRTLFEQRDPIPLPRTALR